MAKVPRHMLPLTRGSSDFYANWNLSKTDLVIRVFPRNTFYDLFCSPVSRQAFDACKIAKGRYYSRYFALCRYCQGKKMKSL